MILFNQKFNWKCGITGAQPEPSADRRMHRKTAKTDRSILIEVAF